MPLVDRSALEQTPSSINRRGRTGWNLKAGQLSANVCMPGAMSSLHAGYRIRMKRQSQTATGAVVAQRKDSLRDGQDEAAVGADDGRALAAVEEGARTDRAGRAIREGRAVSERALEGPRRGGEWEREGKQRREEHRGRKK